MFDQEEERTLLDNLPGMVFRCEYGEERKLLFASAGCLELTGYTAAELAGEPGYSFADLIHADDQPAVRREIEAALLERRPYYCLYRLIRSDDSRCWVWECGRGVLTEDGAFSVLEGFVAAAREQVPALDRLQEQVFDQTRKLSALHGILEAVSAPVGFPEILNRSLEAALVAARGDAGFIHLHKGSDDVLHLAAQQGLARSVSESMSSVSTGDGLVAYVARNREPLLVPDIHEDGRTVYLASSDDLKVYVGVPISRGEHVWGTLSVLGKEPSQFGNDEVAVLISVGEEIGVVIENARLRRQADELLLIQERNRLARELHDSVSQSLYSVTLFAEAGRRTSQADNDEEAAAFFNQIGETGQQALKEMRLLIHNLRPSILAKEGLVRALQHRLNSVEGRAGVKSRLIVEGEVELAPAIEDALYHIAHEALNNALKHAMASEVVVRLTVRNGGDGVVVLRIEDNGQGFDADMAFAGDGMGLTTMKERAASFGGLLDVQSTRGQGSILEACLTNTGREPKARADFDVEDLL